jgi:hypothetical protein
MQDAIAKLKAGIDMKPRKRVVDLPAGGTFEFYTTPLTLAERERAQQMAKKPDEVSLTLLVQKCRDENGGPLFSMAHIAELKNDFPAELIEAIQVKAFVEIEEEAVVATEKADIKSPAEGTRKGRRADAAAGDSGEAGQDGF